MARQAEPPVLDPYPLGTLLVQRGQPISEAQLVLLHQEARAFVRARRPMDHLRQSSSLFLVLSLLALLVVLYVVIAAEDMGACTALLAREFSLEWFPHSLNVSTPGSELRVQIRTDPRYSAFVGRASMREILGLRLPVAAVEDLLQGKLWAVGDIARRASVRQKDLADIARLLESYPSLRERVPLNVLSQLL